jgi:hypothetical protein
MSAVTSNPRGILPSVYSANRIGGYRPPQQAWAGLDTAYEMIFSGQVPEGMTFLAQHLLRVKNEAGSDWERMALALTQSHPLGRLLWQDPFTYHSYSKPRGYSGDAELLDYLYGILPAPDDTTPLGREVFDFMIRQQGSLSVQSRGRILAKLVDETADQFDSPRILSIACGHLREAANSQALKEGRIGEFVALDQDVDSLAEVDRLYGNSVRTFNGSVRTILGEKTKFNDYHFVYAAGLYDYLSERIAKRLTRLMFDMVAPGGRLLIANFAPTLPENGYMETFMNWTLIYRNPEEMTVLDKEIATDAWKSRRLFWDEHENIIFLELIKRSSPVKAHYVAGGSRFSIPGLQNVTLAPDLKRRIRPSTKRRGDDSSAPNRNR